MGWTRFLSCLSQESMYFQWMIVPEGWSNAQKTQSACTLFVGLYDISLQIPKYVNKCWIQSFAYKHIYTKTSYGIDVEVSAKYGLFWCILAYIKAFPGSACFLLPLSKELASDHIQSNLSQPDPTPAPHCNQSKATKRTLASVIMSLRTDISSASNTLHRKLEEVPVGAHTCRWIPNALQ